MAETVVVTDGGQAGGQADAAVPQTFDDWYQAAPEPVKALVDTNTRGLKAALDAERAERKAAEKSLRDAAAKLAAGSDERKALETQAASLAETEKRADFYELAHAAGIADLRLAWLAVQNGQFFTRKGEPDIEALRAAHPALFNATPGATKPPAGNAGAGAGQQPTLATGMNNFIRAAAGVLPSRR